jgi:hypothetical protein
MKSFNDWNMLEWNRTMNLKKNEKNFGIYIYIYISLPLLTKNLEL